MGNDNIAEKMRQMPLESILSETVSDEEISFAHMNIERDNRALWLGWMMCAAADALNRSAAWYRGFPSSVVPERLLSDLIRLGSETSMELLHRVNALVRVSRVENDIHTYGFTFMVIMTNALLQRLNDCFQMREVDNVRRLFHDMVCYCDTAKRKGHTQEQFKEILSNVAKRFCDEWGRMCARIAEEEDVLLQRQTGRPAERRVVEKLDQVAKDVAVIRNQGKKPPASWNVQKWVLDKWDWYVRHPEACRCDKRCKRVYVRDVWAVVQEEAKIRGILDEKAFARIKETASKNRRSREGGKAVVDIATSSPIVSPKSSPKRASSPESSPIGSPMSSPKRAISPESSPIVSPKSLPKRASSPESSPIGSPMSSPKGQMSVLEMVRADDRVTTQAMADKLGVSKRMILRYIKKLSSLGLRFEGSPRTGHWVFDRVSGGI